MGLDLVELVMAVEESFGIELPDAEVEKLLTPALLTDFILTRVQTADQSVCLTRKSFYALRRVLMTDFACKRAQIKPDTPLDALVAHPNRRAAWRRIQETLQADDWLELRRPIWLVIVLALIFAAATAGFWIAGVPLWASALAGILPWRLALEGTRPFRTQFPHSCQTAGELARFLVAHAPKLFEPQGRAWTREEVAETIRRLTIEHLGLNPDQYRADARFVQDLGAD